MMSKCLFALPQSASRTDILCRALDAEQGHIDMRRFPDGETYLRIATDTKGKVAILVSSLEQPDPKLLPLIFAADALRDLGASKVGLVAPYLAYMRQDHRFQPGEAITSRTFAKVLSNHFDWLVTVDPHLHRFASLEEIYTTPVRVVHAAPQIGDWIQANVMKPLVIGPDSESEQWVAQVAARAGAPYVVCSKTRLGDRDVRIAIPDLSIYRDCHPVLIDDVVSSGRTLLVALARLREMGFGKADCAVIHPLFAQDAFNRLSAVCGRIVSTDTIIHPSNAISMMNDIADAVRDLCDAM